METKIKELENSLLTFQSEKVLCEIRKYKMKDNDLINGKTKFLIERLKSNKFQYNNKSSKYFSISKYLIKQNKEKTTRTQQGNSYTVRQI